MLFFFKIKIDSWIKAAGDGIGMEFILRDEKIAPTPVDDTNVYAKAIIQAISEDLLVAIAFNVFVFFILINLSLCRGYKYETRIRRGGSDGRHLRKV